MSVDGKTGTCLMWKECNRVTQSVCVGGGGGGRGEYYIYNNISHGPFVMKYAKAGGEVESEVAFCVEMGHSL